MATGLLEPPPGLVSVSIIFVVEFLTVIQSPYSSNCISVYRRPQASPAALLDRVASRLLRQHAIVREYCSTSWVALLAPANFASCL